jgi:anaerobic selenocysteine-containing dehydrogenase
MGIIHVVIRDSLYNSDFVQNFTGGFSGWKRRVLDDYTPQKVSAITGIDSSEIEKQARAFAAASHPLAICGRGQGDTPVRLNEAMAVYALNALVGNLNQTGGIWSVPRPDYVEWPEVELDSIAQEGLGQNRIDGAGSDKYPLAQSLLNRFPGAVLAGNEYPLGALFISGANPCFAMPDVQTFKNAIRKIPFVVSFSPYMDETAMNADIILPNHIYLEGYQDIPISAGLQRPMIGLAKPVVEPLFDTRHTGDVLIELAQAMGSSVADAFAWDSYEACLEETLGDKWDLLDEEGIWGDEEFQATAWDDAFETESGKFEFGNEALDISPGYASLTLEGDEAAFPLVLLPYDSMRLANGFISDPPFVMKTIEDTVLKGKHVLVEINPQTAKSFGFLEGALADLSTPKGQAKVKIHLYEGMMPGVIALPSGLGHKAEDPYMAGKGVNINELMGPVEDQASGLDAAWGIRAKLVKA